MATVDPTTIDGPFQSSAFRWAPLTTTADTGIRTGLVGSGDRTVQVFGTFGVGGTLIIEGSIDGTNWFQLRDPGSTALSFTAAGGKAVMEGTPFIRPRVTAGDGTTSLTCLIAVRG